MVHYQLPASADMYVHRSGRTGRAGAEGTSIALITPKDAPRFAALLQVRLLASLASANDHDRETCARAVASGRMHNAGLHILIRVDEPLHCTRGTPRLQPVLCWLSCCAPCWSRTY